MGGGCAITGAGLATPLSLWISSRSLLSAAVHALSSHPLSMRVRGPHRTTVLYLALPVRVSVVASQRHDQGGIDHRWPQTHNPASSRSNARQQRLTNRIRSTPPSARSARPCAGRLALDGPLLRHCPHPGPQGLGVVGEAKEPLEAVVDDEVERRADGV